VAQAETVAFGNGSDDAPMLAWAGLGVAIGDAAPEPLAAADRVAPPLKEDGAARVLEDLLERGLVG
jgi:hydroxymethylpyrimidine pyrophosphatase-like HAD family hydrolase